MRFRMPAVLLGLLACLAASTPAAAQEDADSVPPAPPAGDHLTVHLMTMGPGRLVWERFGHNAIRVTDARAGTDVVYNYGIFNFDEAGFIPRLIEGEMLYTMEPADFGRTVELYRYFDRSIWIQELSLTGEEKLALQQFLQWNALPENKAYRYDYYRDNCSTRVRDALDRVLGGELRAALGGVATGETYRSESQRLIAADLPAYTGLLLAMGHPADEPLSAWEDSFVPMRLSEHVRGVSVLNERGERVPLVRSEEVLYESSVPAPPPTQPEWLGWYVLVGGAVALVFAVLGVMLERRRARVAFAAGATVWLLVMGVLGSLLLFLWGTTEHVFTYANENVLQFNPVALVLAGLVPLALFGRPWAARAAALAAGVGAVLSVVGFAVQVFPGIDQPNGEIIALALPAWLALAWAMARWHGSQDERAQLRRVAARRH